jgi:hypothetical protein
MGDDMTLQSMVGWALAAGWDVTVVQFTGKGVSPPISEASATTVEAAPQNRGPSGDPARWTPLERLAAAVADHGEGLRKEGDWAKDICGANDLSQRELERACKHGAVLSTRKDDGRDSGAREIEAAALQAYLELREEVRQGRKPVPEWWESVVPERHRTAK